MRLMQKTARFSARDVNNRMFANSSASSFRKFHFCGLCKVRNWLKKCKTVSTDHLHINILYLSNDVWLYLIGWCWVKILLCLHLVNRVIFRLPLSLTVIWSMFVKLRKKNKVFYLWECRNNRILTGLFLNCFRGKVIDTQVVSWFTIMLILTFVMVKVILKCLETWFSKHDSQMS